MKSLLLFLCMFIVAGCQESIHDYPTANGKYFSWGSYKCEFGVLYSWGYEMNAMIDVNGDPIPCTVTKMTHEEFERLR